MNNVCPPAFLLEVEDPGWVWRGMTYGDMEELLLKHRFVIESQKLKAELLKEWREKNCLSP